MTTTVGLFHANFSNPSTGFRAGVLALPGYEDNVLVCLPVLVNTRAAVAALTGHEHYPSLLQALLACGWQDLNYLFENGAWYELTDMLGTKGNRLAPPREEPAIEEATEPEKASDKQLETLYKVTKSHVFDQDREALRGAAEKATLEEASVLLDYVLREVKTRKEAEKQAAYPGRF